MTFAEAVERLDKAFKTAFADPIAALAVLADRLEALLARLTKKGSG